MAEKERDMLAEHEIAIRYLDSLAKQFALKGNLADCAALHTAAILLESLCASSPQEDG